MPNAGSAVASAMYKDVDFPKEWIYDRFVLELEPPAFPHWDQSSGGFYFKPVQRRSLLPKLHSKSKFDRYNVICLRVTTTPLPKVWNVVVAFSLIDN